MHTHQCSHRTCLSIHFFSCVFTRREAFSLLYLDQLDPCSSQAMGCTGKTTKERQHPVARKRPATAKAKVTRKKAADSASSSQKQRLLYPRWIDIQDDHIEPSAFATKVAQHYAAKGFSMTAVNVQSLIAEAEDALDTQCMCFNTWLCSLSTCSVARVTSGCLSYGGCMITAETIQVW